ncbi:uncharacterized protein LOC132066101 [Lycium ferocissimum]|uniref:uncharacterized protein LOC132066101 n=1 Tax=Lycium ferocissimum TaxID=112874 RepID=UPI00281599FA|nr:uncharacterized protein LOC132066101 [Lycium ferocissimum]
MKEEEALQKEKDREFNKRAKFAANFWKSFQKGLGTKVNLITTFHPQTDGQAERTVQTLEDMLKARVLDFKALYGPKCRSPIGEVELLGPDLVYQTIKKVKLIQERLRTTQSHQKSYTDVQVSQVAYKIELPQELAAVHLVFHVSMLRNCVGDPSLAVPADTIIVKDALTYE